MGKAIHQMTTQALIGAEGQRLSLAEEGCSVMVGLRRKGDAARAVSRYLLRITVLIRRWV